MSNDVEWRKQEASLSRVAVKTGSVEEMIWDRVFWASRDPPWLGAACRVGIRYCVSMDVVCLCVENVVYI